MMNGQTLKGIGFSLLATATLVIFLTAWFLFGQTRHVVYADELTIEVRGQYETVEEVLTAAGVTLSPHDRVRPNLTASADPDTAIAIERAQAVELRTESGRQTIWTHQDTLGGFIAETRLTINRTDQIYADGRLITITQLNQTPLPQSLEIGQFMTITVQDGENQQVIRTDKQTVGEALLDAGIKIFAADGTEPSLGSWLRPNMTVTIERSKPLTIQVDGRVIQTRSHRTFANDVLAEAGIGLVGFDYARPAPDQPLKAGDVIQVIRVTEDFRVVDDPIPYESLIQPTDQLEIDQRAVLQAGTSGILRRRVRVRYENGAEVSQTPDGEWVAQEPVNEIVGYGTNIVIRTLDTPEGPVEYWRKVRMRVTAYMAQTSGKPKDHPAYGITASGVPAGYGVVAVDPKVVPFRSEVYVPGYGVGFAGDTGGGVKGRWIDLGYEDNWDTFEHWSGYVDVYYLTPVPPPDKINYLIPTVLP